MPKNKMSKFKLKSLPAVRQGMSFVEAIIGIFIFAVVMFAVTNIFTSSFNGYKKADKMQKNIENAQFAMNRIAKSLRTSRIDSISSSETKTIKAYDFSEAICNEYSFNAGTITRRYSSSTTCDMSSGAIGPIPITTQYVDGSFFGSASSNVSVPKKMGKVTISIKVCSETNCAGTKNDQVVLQTTVSLRDYSTVGL